MASQDHGARVQHIEGTSYAVAFGDPERHPLPSWEDYNCPAFPAGDGLNPYEPESHLLAPLIEEMEPETMDVGIACRAGCALSAYVYEVIKFGSERSFERTRGLSTQHMLHITRELYPNVKTVVEALKADPTLLCISMLVCLYRMCHLDGTFAAFSETPPEIRSGDDSALAGFYFTLSAQERKRHRVLRRMPYVVARQLALKKNKKKNATPQRRLLALEDAPDDLFRLVVSFL